jgi:hypothetical protein
LQLRLAYRLKWSWLLNKRRLAKMEEEGDQNEDDLPLQADAQTLVTPCWWKCCGKRTNEYQPLEFDAQQLTAQVREAIVLASAQRPPPPPPSFIARLARLCGINYNALRALARIWKKMPKGNRDSDSIKPLPVKMKFIDFNSWLYSGSDSLWAAFASHLFQETESHFGEITTRIYRARYNDAFGKFGRAFFICTFLLIGLIVAAGICVWQKVGPFNTDSGEDTGDLQRKTFAGLGSALLFAFLGLVASSKDVIQNLVTSQAQSILNTMNKSDNEGHTTEMRDGGIWSECLIRVLWMASCFAVSLHRPDFSSRMGFMNQIKEEIDIIRSVRTPQLWRRPPSSCVESLIRPVCGPVRCCSSVVVL